jgi:excisionase family DNA binding protein
MDEWLTTEELCSWLKVEREWVWDQCQRRKIPHVKLGRRLRFRRILIEAWLQGMTVEPTRPHHGTRLGRETS